MRTRDIKLISAFFLVNIMLLSGQPSFVASTATVFSQGQILHTVLRDENTWLLYVYATNTVPNYQYYLLKTTDGGNSYFIVNTLPPGFSALKFLAKGDTVIATGNKIVKSTDFGNTWSSVPPPSLSEEYDDIVLMPDNHLWLSGAASGTNKLYETDYNLASFALKYAENTGFSAILHNRFKFISSFSNDTVYFNLKDNFGNTYMKKTTDNGLNWTTSLSLLPGVSLLNGARISYIKYHTSSRANVFVFYSGFPTDYITNDGFNSLQKDTLDPASHALHEAYNWLQCSGKNYLAYDAHEDSSPGIQEIVQASDGRLIFGAFYSANAVNLTQKNHFALGGKHDLHTLFISNLCNTLTYLKENKPENHIHVCPNPSTGEFKIQFPHEGTYFIVNQLSQTVRSVNLSESNNYSVTIENLNKGLYFIKGSDPDKNIHQKIVILDR